MHTDRARRSRTAPQPTPHRTAHACATAAAVHAQEDVVRRLEVAIQAVDDAVPRLGQVVAHTADDQLCADRLCSRVRVECCSRARIDPTASTPPSVSNATAAGTMAVCVRCGVAVQIPVHVRSCAEPPGERTTGPRAAS